MLKVGRREFVGGALAGGVALLAARGASLVFRFPAASVTRLQFEV